MQKSTWWLLILLVGTLTLAACVGNQSGVATPIAGEGAPTAIASPTEEPSLESDATPEALPSDEQPLLRVVTHDSFAISPEVLDIFQQKHGVTVEFVPLGDTGSMVNQSILSVNNPLGDVMYGVDNTFLTRALNAGLFEPYESPNLAQVEASLKLDPEQRVTPVDYGDVCLNYDKNYFEEAALAPPTSLEDLVKEEYKGLTVVQNPATSSPGLAFLLTTVEHFGEEGWQQYWRDLRANEVLVTSGWSEAYFSHFTAGGDEGTYPIVLSYASSPAAAEGQTGSVLSDGSCFRQIEFAGVLKNGNHPELARAFIDFLLTPDFQNDVPGQMYVFPVITEATLPDEFIQYAEIPVNPVLVEPSFIEENRDALIDEWTEIVIR